MHKDISRYLTQTRARPCHTGERTPCPPRLWEKTGSSRGGAPKELILTRITEICVKAGVSVSPSSIQAKAAITETLYQGKLGHQVLTWFSIKLRDENPTPDRQNSSTTVVKSHFLSQITNKPFKREVFSLPCIATRELDVYQPHGFTSERGEDRGRPVVCYGRRFPHAKTLSWGHGIR